MKNNILIKLYSLILISAFPFKYGLSQTDFIFNGGFEKGWTRWDSEVVNGNLLVGPGGCNTHSGDNYLYLGTSNGYGLNDAQEDAYQNVSIPSTATSCVLKFYTSINTDEPPLTTAAFDKLWIRIRNTNGDLLYTAGYLSNLNGKYGIPGCQNWVAHSYDIPSTFFGTRVRICFEFETHYNNPTIFRVDDISLMVTMTNPCTYSLSKNTFTCTIDETKTYMDVATVTSQSNCPWSAIVTSGNTWLKSSSMGIGGGPIIITVTQNTTSNFRAGTINVGDQILTIYQTNRVGDEELNNLNHIRVYPNPSKAITNIDLGEIRGNKTIHVMDLTGKQIKSIATENTEVALNLTGFAQGIYILNIETEQGVKNVKLVLE